MQVESNLKGIWGRFPEKLRNILFQMPEDVIAGFEEIRIKVNSPILIYSKGKEYFVNSKRISLTRSDDTLVINKQTLESIFNSVLNYSVYAYQEELINGYVTIEGGHRVGICGKTVVEGGKIKTIKDISSLNIRRSREIIGISDPYMKYILKSSTSIYNTLIVSPPKCGKTTLLRDFIRNLSTRGLKVGVVDERSELAGMYNGVPQNNLGMRTDILDGCPKEKGIMMLIRSMSPDVIATDEIGKEEDVYAINSALNAGINLMTTIHGNDYEDLNHSNIRKLLDRGIFERIILLSNQPVTGHVRNIINEKNETILQMRGEK